MNKRFIRVTYTAGLIILMIILGCTGPMTYVTDEDRQEAKQWMLMQNVDDQMRHERLVQDCYQYDSCKNDYERYNGDYLEKTYGRKQ